jgi:hypothetical protein
VLLDEEVTAAMRAISVVANHRLERGIWTSPGAGDLRRATAACEKLVMLVGGCCGARWMGGAGRARARRCTMQGGRGELWLGSSSMWACAEVRARYAPRRAAPQPSSWRCSALVRELDAASVVEEAGADT